MAITYDSGTNIITVTGYTEATPCNFTDVYNADKAGTLSLHARTGITAVDGAAVAVDRAERPADYIVLGGASNDLYITIANWVGTTATIQITGTDRAGNALTEDIVVTADGTYYTTKLFKTITHTQVTVFTATGFDYDLTQGQWGVVWNQGNEQFFFDANLMVGPGTTFFTDKKKHIIFNNGITWKASDSSLVHITLGEKISDKFGKDGCHVRWVGGSYSYNDINCVFHAYASSFTGVSPTDKIYLMIARRDGSELIDVTLSSFIYGEVLKKGYGYNINLVNLGHEPLSDPSATLNNVFIKNCKYNIAVSYSNNVTVKNMVAETPTNMAVRAYNYSGTTNLINADFDVWTFYWQVSNVGKIYRQYELNLKVIDKDNTSIQTATVKIYDKDSNLIVDTTTDASGDIATQTISRGYYNQANGNTLQEYSPHKIEIRKAGTNFLTYETDFILSEKTKWVIMMVDMTDIRNDIAALQTDLDNPDQYKADVSALATAIELAKVSKKVDRNFVVKL